MKRILREEGHRRSLAYGLGGKHLIVALILKCYHDSLSDKNFFFSLENLDC